MNKFKYNFLGPTNSIKLRRILQDFKEKAGGLDNISSIVLRTMSDSISEPMAYILNLCIDKFI